MIAARERLIVALDVSTAVEAQKLVGCLGESVALYKLGMQLYTAEGPRLVRELISSGRKVFLDLKYHDIPNTVAAAVAEAAKLGVSLLTVHATGGRKMLQSAVEAAGSGPKVLAVTVLTSMQEHELSSIGVGGRLLEHVVNLAGVALEAGCSGVVSAAGELPTLRARFGDRFLAVTPGVRPREAGHQDQARVATPAEAIRAGATHLVVGRPIIQAARPRDEADRILAEISQARRETRALA
jgi:orotidine-5'-phosphate decarboxylase